MKDYIFLTEAMKAELEKKLQPKNGLLTIKQKYIIAMVNEPWLTMSALKKIIPINGKDYKIIKDATNWDDERIKYINDLINCNVIGEREEMRKSKVEEIMYRSYCEQK